MPKLKGLLSVESFPIFFYGSISRKSSPASPSCGCKPPFNIINLASGPKSPLFLLFSIPKSQNQFTVDLLVVSERAFPSMIAHVRLGTAKRFRADKASELRKPSYSTEYAGDCQEEKCNELQRGLIPTSIPSMVKSFM